jgi:hypothetical protein
MMQAEGGLMSITGGPQAVSPFGSASRLPT